MSGTLQMIGFSLVAALLAMTLRPVSKPAGAVIAVCAGTMLLFFAISRVGEGVGALSNLAARAGLTGASLQAVMKMIGMTYLTEFAVSVCRDAGEEGLADKVAMCGKALLFSLTLPLLTEIASLAVSLAP